MNEYKKRKGEVKKLIKEEKKRANEEWKYFEECKLSKKRGVKLFWLDKMSGGRWCRKRSWLL